MNFDLESLPPEFLYYVYAGTALRIIVWLLYANTINKTVKKIAPENRHITPRQAWLVALPIFNIYWNFVVARRLSDSLTNEFFDRKIAEEENPGQARGLLYAWLFLASNIPFPMFILFTIAMLSLIYFIVYWVKINNFKNILEEHDRFLEYQQQKNEDTRTDELS